MVIFSHRGIGFGRKENSVEAITAAVEKGLSVEVDLRIIKNDIILSHDSNAIKPPSDFDGLIKLIRDNPNANFALHLKDDSSVLFNRVGDSVKGLNNCFIFVTDFAQERFISEIYSKQGSKNTALYATEEVLDQALLRKVEYLWLDETKARIYDKLNYFLSFDKKVVCCSPELFMSADNARLKDFHKIVSLNRQGIFGVCTDFCDSFTGLEDIQCPVCGFNGPFHESASVNGYTLIGCGSCGLEFSHPMRYDAGYYESLLYSDEPNLNSVIKLSRDQFLEKAAALLNNRDWQPYNLVFKWIEKNAPRGSIVLDIGCGVGWFLAALESKGFKAIGIEVSSHIVELLKSKGFQAYPGPLENIDIDLPEPDLVLLLGVIEHVQDPVGLLRDIHRRFPKAMFFISIPNPKRWDFRLGIRNYWDFPPNHLMPVWSQKSLEIALEKGGFQLKEWLFPSATNDEIWLILMEKLLFRLGLRRKGYFVGLTSEALETKSIFKMLIKVLYRELEKTNIIAKFISWPFLRVSTIIFKRKGYSGLSALALAQPVSR